MEIGKTSSALKHTSETNSTDSNQCTRRKLVMDFGSFYIDYQYEYLQNDKIFCVLVISQNFIIVTNIQLFYGLLLGHGRSPVIFGRLDIYFSYNSKLKIK